MFVPKIRQPLPNTSFCSMLRDSNFTSLAQLSWKYASPFRNFDDDEIALSGNSSDLAIHNRSIRGNSSSGTTASKSHALLQRKHRRG